mgnify:CR=1 FL=1
MKERLKNDLIKLMKIPGLSGYEDRVRRFLQKELALLGLKTQTDRLGNLMTSFSGNGPCVMLFAHMDQLGFVVRKIEKDGFILVERLGGVPEKALPSQEVLILVEKGPDVRGLIANKSHHATTQSEKYQVLPYKKLYIDVGLRNAKEVEKAGIRIGSPIVFSPKSFEMGQDRIAGTSVDDRAGCAVVLEIARYLSTRTKGPPVHLVFTVQEEYNLRGALPIAQKLLPDIAIQLDLIMATDTPDMKDRGNIILGHGPAMSMFSFHGRGTLNGVIPNPKMVALFEETSKELKIPLQRSAHIGALTDLSYVQLVGEGVVSIDLGFPIRYSHSSLEVCDLNDLVGLTRLLIGALEKVDPKFSLERDF